VDKEDGKPRLAFGEDQEKSASASYMSFKSSAIDEEDEQGDEANRPSTAAETGLQASSMRACSARQNRKTSRKPADYFLGIFDAFRPEPTFRQRFDMINMQFRLTNSQRYLVNAKPDTNHSTNPTNPNGNSKR